MRFNYHEPADEIPEPYEQDMPNEPIDIREELYLEFAPLRETKEHWCNRMAYRYGKDWIKILKNRVR